VTGNVITSEPTARSVPCDTYQARQNNHDIVPPSGVAAWLKPKFDHCQPAVVRDGRLLVAIVDKNRATSAGQEVTRPQMHSTLTEVK
jgi:hypothetical protein